MKKTLTAITALALVAGCASHSIDDQGVMQVKDNTGGMLAHYEKHIARINAEQIPLRISGLSCLSACTTLVFLPTSCIDPNTRVGFHGAQPRHPTDEAVNLELDKRVAQYYPPEIRKRFMDEWRHNGLLDYTFKTPAELAEITPEVKLC